ncbi:YfhO family protein [Planctomyces sp. SH-PL62]|uniref:YfhO family protein n=1 Tax=Planctomyces sp. SH-PL62 TaxID=1636152 RepID=UPI00078CEFE7|nr:YfhO family protein [Planctomyces sp. SH-PL62]AMV39185.1 Bacterial membrane protein YfhO [Planctomyces sp. SH-PL62]
MTRDSLIAKLLVFGCLAALLLACFHRVLLDGHQFAYRDAAHFYYPLYERVQREWDAGRWPLWEPEENSGMPLMGNPTAAVLYPGKVVYAVLPYAWAARLYIVGHVALAFAAMLALMRSWKVSWTGAGLSALSYSFCGPILFQYCNIIYLVGAAWLPLGFLAVDRWIRDGSRWAVLGLAVVLAMQTLGGDPQSAYLMGLCALAYAAGAAWTSGRGFREAQPPEPSTTRTALPWRAILLGLLVAGIWTMATLELARVLPSLRPAKLPDKPTPPLPWMLWAPAVVPVVWAIVLAIYFVRKKPTRERRTVWRLAMGLGVAGALAGALTAAQLLPVVEFTQQTTRAAAGGPHEIYPFSVEPFRLVEMLWPNVFGSYFDGNASWVDLVKISADRSKVWVPSLYMGGAVILLALAAVAFRRGDAARVWLSWIVVVTLLGSFGEFSSPIWASRFANSTLGVGYPGIGPFDPPNDPPLRKDGHLRDGDGGVYWAMTTFLPGFRQFRFPSKLMTFSILGIAALAGFGWDDLGRGRERRLRRSTVVLLSLSSACLLGWLSARGPILKVFEGAQLSSSFGPFDPVAAYGETRRALGQGVLVFAATLGLVALRPRRPGLACAAVLLLVTLDLGLANRRMIATAPQELFEVEPEVLGVIKAAEAARPSDGPYRIHRSPIWNPAGWIESASDDRVRDFMEWERATIQPKYGITLGVEYTHTIGVAELYDYEWYFGGWLFSTSPEFARSIGITPGQKVVYFPRRSFDMWNTRYFILPSYTNDWLDENRGFAAFLADTEIIHPRPGKTDSPESRKQAEDWVKTKDYQIRRNLNQFPRAWVVHRAKGLTTLRGMSPEARSGPMMEIMYDDNDPIWRDPTMISYDPRQIAWVENDDAAALAPFTRGGVSRPSEVVKVGYPRSDRVELDVTLDAPGIVVLADVYYPGWKLTIDGQPSPVYRVNRMMRGAAVESGTHHLVYSYEPRSFRLGLLVSMAGLGVALGLAAFASRRPRTPLPWTAAVAKPGA